MEQRYLRAVWLLANDKRSQTVKERQPDVVARMISISSKLSWAPDAETLFRQAYFAAALHLSNPGASSTVAAILDDIDFATLRNSPIYTIMRGLSYAIASVGIISGVFLIFTIGGFFSIERDIFVATKLAWKLLETSPFIIAIFFGVLGSVVSILLRLSEFEQATRRSRQFLLMSGAMLPFVGAVFACVTAAMFACGIINFNFAGEGGVAPTKITNPYFYIVVGFLSGFSERFTRGLLGSAEKTFSATAHREVEFKDSFGGTERAAVDGTVTRRSAV